MKKLISLLTIITSLSCYATIECGDKVMENVGDKQIRTVRAISGDYYLLSSSDMVYHRSNVHLIVSKDQDSGIEIGDQVKESSFYRTYYMHNDQEHSIRTVINITNDGFFQLDNQGWYPAYQIHALLEQKGDITKGSMVLEDWGPQRSFQRVLAIATDGTYLLSNHFWYHEDDIYPADCQDEVCQ